MNLDTQFWGRLGLVLVLIGGTGFAGGNFIQAQDDCVSGTGIEIANVSSQNTTAFMNQTAPFSELSPDEQRIFLEAYTESTEEQRLSEPQMNWSDSWFVRESSTTDQFGDQSRRIRYVEYRNEYWELTIFHADCGVSSGTFIWIGGVLVLVLGGSVLAIAGLWRLLSSSR
jgi:hypothetical protein